MAITLRAGTGGTASNSTSVTVTLPAGFQAGDICLVQVLVTTHGGTWTLPSGWTRIQALDFGVYSQSFAFRVLAGGDPNPVFTYSKPGNWSYSGAAWYSSSSGILGLDSSAATVTGSAATSITPGADTVTHGGTDHASIITLCAVSTAAATTSSHTYTPSSGWSAPASSSGWHDGTATVKARGAFVAWEDAVTGTVTPGSESITDSASDVFALAANHAIIYEATSTPSGPFTITIPAPATTLAANVTAPAPDLGKAWTKLTQPSAGGTMNVVDVNPNDGRIAGASDTQGFYLTTDQGNHWQVINAGIGAAGNYNGAASVAWSQTETNTLYGAVGGGFLASVGVPAPWVLRSGKPSFSSNGGPGPLPGAPGPRSTGRLIAQDGTYVYVATDNQGIMRSSVQGGAKAGADNFPVTFKMAGAAPGGGYYARSVCTDGSGNLWAGFYGTGGGNGGLWVCTAPHAAAPNFTQVAGTPAIVNEAVALGGYVYCAADSSGVWQYNVSGTSWRNIGGSVLDTTTSVWNGVDAVASGGTHVVGAVCITPDQNTPPATGYQTFALITAGSSGAGSLTYSLLNQSNVNTATLPPAGQSFVHWNISESLGGAGGKNYHVRFDPTDATQQTMYISGSMGFFRSYNQGSTWAIAVLYDSAFHAYSVACDQNNPGHLVFSDSDFGAWDITDGIGYSNSTVTNDNPGGESRIFAYDPVDSTTYTGYGTKYSNSSGGEVAQRAWNAPNAWTSMGLGSHVGGFVPTGLCAFRDTRAGSPMGGWKVVIAAVQANGLWQWTSKTSSWSKVSANALTSTQTELTSSDYMGSGIVFVFDRAKGIFRSTNYGDTWSTSPIWAGTANGSISNGYISVNPAVSGELWVSANSGLYKLSIAGGGTGAVTPTQITAPQVAANQAVKVGPDGTVYVTTADTGTGIGIWSLAPGATKWTNVDPLGVFASSSYATFQMDISSAGQLYVATGNILSIQAGGGGGAAGTFNITLPGPATSLAATVTPAGGGFAGFFNITLPGPATSLTATTPATASGFYIAVVIGDSTAASQSFLPAGWNALQSVSATNGSDHTCDVQLTAAWTANAPNPTVTGTTGSASDLSGAVVGVLSTATPPAAPNAAWPVVKFEAAFGGGFQTPPDELAWTDLTSRLWRWDETTGIQYELGQVQATALNLECDNFDNALASDNPGSLYYSDALNQNMSFQSGLTPWTANNNAAIAQSSAQAYASDPGAIATYSMQVTPDGLTPNPGALSEYLTITQGASYAASGWFWSATPWPTGVQAGINWYDVNQNYLSSTAGTGQVLTATTWTQATATGTPPAGAVYGQIYVQALGIPAQVFYFAEAALASGTAPVSTGLVTTGTPLRIRAAIGTLGGVTENLWYVIQRNAERWPQQLTETWRRYAPVTATDIWSALSATCVTPYRGEILADEPQSWWPCDDQPLPGGVLPVTLNNAAPGNPGQLNVVLSPLGAPAQDYYDVTGKDTVSYHGALLGIATYAVGTSQGWMYGDPVASTGAYTSSGDPLSASPGSAAWQAAGQAGQTGSYGWFLSRNDPSFPPLSSGVTVEGWFNVLFYASTYGNSGDHSSSSYSGPPICQQPEGVPITLFELATNSAPVAKVQLDVSGHLNLITYAGTTATSHSIYTTSDLRSQAWVHVAVALTTTTFAVYVNGGATAAVTGTMTAATSAWTWLIVNGDLGVSGGSAAGTGLVNGANMSVSHLAVYPLVLPPWRVRAHYWAAATASGLLPAPGSVTIDWIATDAAGAESGIVADSYAPDGTGPGTYDAIYGVAVAAVATANISTVTSAPSAWTAVATSSTDYTTPDQTLWISWTGVTPLYNVYTSTAVGGEKEAAVVAGSGDSFTHGFGGAAHGAGVCQTASGSGASPPAAGTAIGDTAGQRVERILGYGNTTYPGRCVDPSPLLVQAATDVGGQQAAQNVTNIAQGDSALLFIDNLGNLSYWDRAHLGAQSPAWTITPQAPPTPGTSLSAIPYSRDVEWTGDPQKIFTAITVDPFSPDTNAQLPLITPQNSAAVQAAQAQWGAQPLEIFSYLQSTTEQQAQANWLFTQFGTLRTRIEQAQISAAAWPAAFPLILGVNIGDLATVQNWQIGGGAITGTFRVTGIQRVLEFGGQSGTVDAKVTLQLDPEPASYWS